MHGRSKPRDHDDGRCALTPLVPHLALAQLAELQPLQDGKHLLRHLADVVARRAAITRAQAIGGGGIVVSNGQCVTALLGVAARSNRPHAA